MDASQIWRVTRVTTHSHRGLSHPCPCNSAESTSTRYCHWRVRWAWRRVARKLAREGYSLALLARSKDKLEALCNEINARGQPARAYVHDVSEYDSVPDLLRKIVADLGGLDLVVFVAGVNYPPGGIDKYNFENDRKMIEVNLIGAMAWLSPIAEMFQSAKAGQIVGISSVAGDRGRVGNPGYNTSKAGLSTYLEALRNRLTRDNVNVLTVKPGFLKTEMLKAAQGATPFAIEPEKAADDILKAMTEAQTGYLHGIHLALDHADHTACAIVYFQTIIILNKEGDGHLMQTMSLPLNTFTQLENFGHSLKASSYRIQIKQAEDIYEAFQLAKKLGLTVTARGTGISYNDASLNGGGIVLDMSGMNQIVEWEPATGHVRCEPGVTLQQLWQRVEP